MTRMQGYRIAAALLLIPMVGSCSKTNIAIRALPAPANASVPDSEALAKGKMLFGRGEFALAADAFRRAVRQDPASADAYNGLAASYDQLGRYDLSRRYYELALSRAPEDGRILRNLARSEVRQGHDLAARKLILEAAAIDQGLAAQARAAVPALEAQVQAPAQQTQPQTEPQQAFGSARGSVTVALEDQPQWRPAELFHRLAATVGLADLPDRLFPQPDGAVTVPIAPSPSIAAEVQTNDPARPRLYVLNGVGRRHQAARMRSYLGSNGWQLVSTGDSRTRQVRSRILFRAGDERSARQLAATLPFQPRLQITRTAPAILLVLGRDAVAFDDHLLAPKRS